MFSNSCSIANKDTAELFSNASSNSATQLEHWMYLNLSSQIKRSSFRQFVDIFYVRDSKIQHHLRYSSLIVWKYNGQINNGRVLIPIRAVSENLGASVEWFQAEKEVKIINGDSTIWLAANFKRTIIESPPTTDNPDIPHREYIDLDTATQVIKGTTYVPLRFVGQSLGANVLWNQQSKQATLTLGGKGLVVNMEQPSVQITDKQKIMIHD